MYTTPNLALTAWDLETDPYNHDQLANNWILIDAHDHTSGNGAPIPAEALPEITQDNLGAGIIGTGQIADGAVTNPKLAASAVATNNIATSAVTSPKIASNAITTAMIQDGAVTEIKLASNAVTTNKIADLTITSTKLGNSQVTGAKLANNAVTQTKIATGSVTTTKIVDGAVSTSKLGADAVTRPKIGSNAVGTDELGQVPCVFVSINSSQTIPDDTLTPIDWDYNKYDTDDMWDQVGDTTIVRIRTSGLYLIIGGVLWSGSSDTTGRMSRVRKNNTPLAGSGPNNVKDEDGLNQVRQSFSGIVNCDDGDTIDLAVKQSSGGNRSIKPEGLLTHLSVTWIAPNPV